MVLRCCQTGRVALNIARVCMALCNLRIAQQIQQEADVGVNACYMKFAEGAIAPCDGIRQRPGACVHDQLGQQ